MSYIDRINNRDRLTNSDIHDAIYSFSKDNGIEDRVKNIVIINRDDPEQDKISLGSYNASDRKLLINVPKIEKTATKRICNLRVGSFYRTNYYNTILLHVIYHELIHAWQKNVFDGSVEARIMKKYSPALFNETFYMLYHDLLPSEREANILASDMLLKLYNSLSVFSDYEKRLLLDRYMTYLTDGYDENSYPFQTLIELYNRRKSKKILDDYQDEISELSLFNRVKFGFSLKRDEYDYLMILNNDIYAGLDPKLSLRRYECRRH